MQHSSEGGERGEEVEVAGGGELEFAERRAMDGDDVGEPERQAGNIVCKDFLNFAAENLPFITVHFGANLID